MLFRDLKALEAEPPEPFVPGHALHSEWTWVGIFSILKEKTMMARPSAQQVISSKFKGQMTNERKCFLLRFLNLLAFQPLVRLFIGGSEPACVYFISRVIHGLPLVETTPNI